MTDRTYISTVRRGFDELEPEERERVLAAYTRLVREHQVKFLLQDFRAECTKLHYRMANMRYYITGDVRRQS